MFDRLRMALAVVFVILAGSACSSSGAEIALVASESEDDPSGTIGFAHAGEDVTGGSPTLTVRAGEPVTVTVENLHGRYSPTTDSHDFAVVPADLEDIRTLAATQQLADEALWQSALPKLFGGETGEVTFTPSEPGTYVYLCTLPGHADAGMMGVFIVE